MSRIYSVRVGLGSTPNSTLRVSLLPDLETSWLEPAQLGCQPWTAERLDRAYELLVAQLIQSGADRLLAADVAKGLLERTERDLWLAEAIDIALSTHDEVLARTESLDDAQALRSAGRRRGALVTVTSSKAASERRKEWPRYPRPPQSTESCARNGAVCWIVRGTVHYALVRAILAAAPEMEGRSIVLVDPLRYSAAGMPFGPRVAVVSIWNALLKTAVGSVGALGAAATWTFRRVRGERYTAALGWARLLRELWRAWLSRHRPALLVACDHRSQVELAAFRVAAGLGVPTAYVQHGLFYDTPRKCDLAYDEYWVFGPRDAEILSRRSSSGAVIPVGSPLLPKWNFANQPAPQLSRVLLISQPRKGPVSELNRRELVHTFLAALDELEERITGVVKLHPTESSGYVERYVAGHRAAPRVRFEAHGLARELMRPGDLVVAFHSTVLIEAALMGLPAVSYSPAGALDFADYEAYGIAFVEREVNALRRRIVELARHPELPAACGRVNEFVVGDGHAAERIAERVRNVLPTSRSDR